MQREAADVASYLKELPAERQEALTRLRGICQETLKGYTEGMDYGMPCFKRDGAMVIAFASQKQYIALYGIREQVRQLHREALAGCDLGKSCIRWRNPERMDFEAIREMLRKTAESSA